MHIQETDRRMGSGASSAFDTMLGFSAEATTPGSRPPGGSHHHDDSVRWPLWKTLLFIVSVCGAFWTALIYAVLQLVS